MTRGRFIHVNIHRNNVLRPQNRYWLAYRTFLSSTSSQWSFPGRVITHLHIRYEDRKADRFRSPSFAGIFFFSSTDLQERKHAILSFRRLVIMQINSHLAATPDGSSPVPSPVTLISITGSPLRPSSRACRPSQRHRASLYHLGSQPGKQVTTPLGDELLTYFNGRQREKNEGDAVKIMGTKRGHSLLADKPRKYLQASFS